MTGVDLHKEALRQQLLLRALWRDARPAVVSGWLRDGARAPRGLQAYQAHAGALAERALAAAYPTLQQLLGDTSFAALARAHWHAEPPERGDIGQWGAALPGCIAADAQLADEPYLADVARLEWAVHLAACAADAAPATGLERLADAEPAALWLQLQPGTALVRSPHPIVTLWHAHRSDADDRFAPVRAAFAAGSGEAALVRRCGWRTEVLALDAARAGFTAALLAGQTLAGALEAAGDGFAFEPWLLDALQCGALAAVAPHPITEPT
ncbi:putative DNA-binding domain-containing protein [Rubrivivax sp. RP6-9]|uniref:HvfC/BufC family peptide modification chaperone n=1 Tax=Rubrivivax sp. RP6-9 TaxID=3415750 RepID=UPI003CC54936